MIKGQRETEIQEIENLFHAGKRVIMKNSKVDGKPHPKLSPLMTMADLREIAGDNPDALKLIDLFGNEKGVKKILDLFELDLYHFHEIIDPTKEQINNLVNLKENGLKIMEGAEIYLPQEIVQILKEINEQFFQKFDQNLEIRSGYRSPAYQIYLLCYYGSKTFDTEAAKANNRTLAAVLQTAAPAGCSEHQLTNPAFDIHNFSKDFTHLNIAEIRQSAEWQFFKTLANKYGIIETYGEGTNNGGKGEPWHWRKAKKSKKNL